MTIRMRIKFALRNLKANQYLEIPFILSMGAMLSLFFIMMMLSANPFVWNRHEELVMLMRFGVLINALLIMIFAVYANRFLIRRRNKELALYGILGLERKHTRRILFIEGLIRFGWIGLIGVTGGMLFGKLFYLGLNRLLKDKMATLMEYRISWKVTGLTFAFCFLLLLLLHIVNCAGMAKVSPVMLLQKQQMGEGEVRLKYPVLIAGILLLGSGYFIALTTEGTIQSLTWFFGAVLLVTAATYLLFASFTVFVLKMQRRRKAYYYQTRHFLAVSGMLYRMRGNAASLASISILSVGIVTAISVAFNIYANTESIVKTTMLRDYEVMQPTEEGRFQDDRNELTAFVQKTADALQKKSSIKIEHLLVKPEMTSALLQQNNSLVPAVKGEKGKIAYAVFTTQDAYNQMKNEHIALKENEILVSVNSDILPVYEKMQISGKTYQIRRISNIVPGNIGVESYGIVLPDERALFAAAKYYTSLNVNTGNYVPSTVALTAYFDVAGDTGQLYEKEFAGLAAQYENTDREFSSRKEMYQFAYNLNGGFLFLGMMIGVLFLIGTILIMYYKQISEGIEDRERFRIMQEVGLLPEQIKESAMSQIGWMFILPIATAGVHALAASKIIFQLLTLFGISSYSDYAVSLGCVVLVFTLIYYLVYRMTLQIYYKMVR